MQRDFYAHESVAFDATAAENSMRTFLADPSFGRLLMIDEAGFAIVTFSFSFEFRGRAALLDELYVAPHARGRGLGTAALRYVEEICAAEGMQVLQLEVSTSNERANALYQRIGFFDRGNRLLSKTLRPVVQPSR
ncbi:MAG TPA: GNAT family N-acetyltransferase [Thermoanaerobaculia bacterium]|nr:GNAT family N-acetyltransferase [Thermoanaerobaculia bacterium]